MILTNDNVVNHQSLHCLNCQKPEVNPSFYVLFIQQKLWINMISKFSTIFKLCIIVNMFQFRVTRYLFPNPFVWCHKFNNSYNLCVHSHLFFIHLIHISLIMFCSPLECTQLSLQMIRYVLFYVFLCQWF